jgi:hypothetical protein
MFAWVESLVGFAENLYFTTLDFFQRKGMADITQITPQLWTGGAITNEADVDQLVGAHITADIDCRLEFDDQSLIQADADLPNAGPLIDAHPKIAYLFDGVADDGLPKPVSWFQKAWEFAHPILTDGGVVLAHCAAGHNRGPSMCYFLMRASGGMTSADAYALITQKRPVVTLAYRDDADKAIEALGL